MGTHTKIIYEGTSIFFFDHSGLRGEELLKSLRTAMQMILNSDEETLSLADFRNTYINDEIMAYLQSDEAKTAAKKTKKSAVVGVTGIKKIFLNVYNTVTRGGARAFDTIEAAKDYLAS